MNTYLITEQLEKGYFEERQDEARIAGTKFDYHVYTVPAESVVEAIIKLSSQHKIVGMLTCVELVDVIKII